MAKKPLHPDAYRWYRRDPSRALSGMRRLNPEQRGVYCTLIELVYEARGPLIDDDVELARACNCDLRKYRRIKAELVAVDRITVDADAGTIYDARAVRELVAKEVFSETQVNRAKAPRPKRRTRNKVVRFVVHEGDAEKGLSLHGARHGARHGTPEVPVSNIDSKGENPSQENRTESDLSNAPAEPPRRSPHGSGGASSSAPKASNVGPVEPRALEEQRRLLSEFIAQENAPLAGKRTRSKAADRTARRKA